MALRFICPVDSRGLWRAACPGGIRRPRLRLGDLDAHDLLLAARGEHRDERRLARVEGVQELLLHFGVLFGGLACLDEAGQVQVILGVAALEQQAHAAVVGVGVQELVLRALDEGHVQVVGTGAEVLVLLARENVNRYNVRLRVAVLAGLGSGDLRALAGVALDHQVGALPDLPGLHGEGQGRPGLGGLKVVLLILLRHGC
mmetsp:Transcript_120307/g.351540  ORF Transcript_120307/g.351540 Transcript_120307/m.351540 type:complete len:201 (+) Transcript_120307:30-632(+)